MKEKKERDEKQRKKLKKREPYINWQEEKKK